MAQLEVSQIMDQIAQAIIDAGVTKRVYAYPPDSVTVPCAIVGFPTEIEFDSSFGRGSDFASFPVYYMVGKAVDRTTRDSLTSIIKAMKNGLDEALTNYALRVVSAEISTQTVAGIEYLAAMFICEVTT